MSSERVRRAVCNTAATIVAFAVRATSSVLRSKGLLLGAFAALLSAVAASTLFRADMPQVAANSTLKCYDRAGNYEPCVTRAHAPAPRFTARTIEVHQPAGWTTAALYQPSWAISAVGQATSWSTTTSDQPANGTSAPAARRIAASGKHTTVCGRRPIPCFFSALRRGFTHIVTVAASVGQGRPVREHL